MSDLQFEVEYPGKTSQEAYEEAKQGLAGDVPFPYEWFAIKIERFYESQMYRDSKDDEEMRADFADHDWTWVATLKARG